MVFRRKGRTTFYFQARTATGWVSLCTDTTSRTLANRIAAMWESLATDHRAWDVLGRCLPPPKVEGKRQRAPLEIGRLYDLWSDTKQDVAEVRRRLADVDLAPLVAEFLAGYRRKDDTKQHVAAHLEALIPGGSSLLRSEATPDYLTRRLAAYQGSQNTLRKVHSAWSVFFAYCVAPKGLYLRSPMEDVARPAPVKHPPKFYELDVVERIVGWQPTVERRVLFALLYGTGIDLSVALDLTRADVWPETKSVRAAGTKAHTRDRVARVADWTWPIVWEFVAEMLPTSRVFPAAWDRWTCSDWHRQTVGAGTKDTHGRASNPGLGLPHRYPLRNARHHWAVRRLRSGSPVADVQQQLGHASPTLTLAIYGRFLPSAADRDRAEQAATDYESRRRSATGSAKERPMRLSNSRGGT